MSKLSKVIKISTKTSAILMYGSGICGSIVVNALVKPLNINPIVKHVGGSFLGYMCGQYAMEKAIELWKAADGVGDDDDDDDEEMDITKYFMEHGRLPEGFNPQKIGMDQLMAMAATMGIDPTGLFDDDDDDDGESDTPTASPFSSRPTVAAPANPDKDDEN